jgi:hypothetical protein
MLYATIDGERLRPSSTGERAKCSGCGGEVMSKCGEINIHHWAHLSGEDCDSWSEPEGEWHLHWKNKFPKEWQEVYIEGDGKVHRADVKTPNGTVIELQSSSISSEEIMEREDFYSRYAGGMIWVVDGRDFVHRWKAFNWQSACYPFQQVRKFFGVADREEQRAKAFELIGDFPEIAPFKIKAKEKYFELNKDDTLADVDDRLLTPVQWPHARKCWGYSSSPVFFDSGIFEPTFEKMVSEELKCETIYTGNRKNPDIRDETHWDARGIYQYLVQKFNEPKIGGIFEWIGTVNKGKEGENILVNGRDKLHLPKFIVGIFKTEEDFLEEMINVDL